MITIPCPGAGPCLVYDLDLSCCLVSGGFEDPCLGDGTDVPQAIIDSAILAASQMMWVATGRQFGCCQVTIHPCVECPDMCPGSFSSYDDFYSFGYPWYPLHQADGTWTNVSCPCVDSCVCGHCSLKLPYPVCSIDEVIVDGMLLSDDMYRVDNFTTIVLLDLAGPAVTGNCWKGCDNSITLTYGLPVPEMVKLGAAEMACEIIKHCVGRPCVLPQRISSVTRQGVSISFLDEMAFLDRGLTGLYFFDLAARMYNPHRLQRRSTVWSPDVAGRWRVTTWQPGDDTGPGCT